MDRGKRGLDLDYLALYERYLAGESGMALAAECGIDHSGLYASWKRRGLPMRTTADAARRRYAARPELRENIRNAQAARRGATDPIERREKRAQTREARGIGISEHERALAEVLEAAGIAYRQQAAIGPYNADFAFDGLRIALEVDGGGHNSRVRSQRAARDAHMAAAGWRVVHVETRRRDWISVALREVLQ